MYKSHSCHSWLASIELNGITKNLLNWVLIVVICIITCAASIPEENIAVVTYQKMSSFPGSSINLIREKRWIRMFSGLVDELSSLLPESICRT